MNEFQRIANGVYPDEAVAQVAEGRPVGDTLAEFIYHELADVEDRAEAVERMRSAIGELEAVADALEE